MTKCARIGFPVVALVIMITAGCGASSSSRQSAPKPSVNSGASAVAVLAIGDSDASGVGDPSGGGWVARYGALLKSRLGVPVTVDNRAVEGLTSDALRARVAGDASLRQALGKADVILIGTGGADLNPGDDALSAGRCKGEACYTKILQSFDANIAAIAADARRIAPAAVLRAMSLPNAFPGAGNAIPTFIAADISRHEVLAERTSVCRAMQSNNGRCVDVPQAFNGPDANRDAYAAGLMTTDPCCYPSGQGQQLIAKLLIATGVPVKR